MHYMSFAFLATEAKVVSFKMFNSLTTKQQTRKFSSANLKKKCKVQAISCLEFKDGSTLFANSAIFVSGTYRVNV